MKCTNGNNSTHSRAEKKMTQLYEEPKKQSLRGNFKSCTILHFHTPGHSQHEVDMLLGLIFRKLQKVVDTLDDELLVLFNGIHAFGRPLEYKKLNEQKSSIAFCEVLQSFQMPAQCTFYTDQNVLLKRIYQDSCFTFTTA